MGSKKASAHGMWVQAHVLAALEGRLPAAMTVDFGFGKPLHLPSTVTLATAAVPPAGCHLAVRDARAGTEPLVGTVRSA